ncbi:MAG: hypothetical protein P8168_00890 [Deltaproteobacteria bacterium]
MKGLKTTIIIILVLAFSTAAYSQAAPASVKQESVAAPEKATAVQDDDRLPIYKQGWQVFLAPYLWIMGAHLDISHQGRVRGTVVADVPWYDIVPLLFSKVMGGMGRVEIWKGRWGLISDTNFIYISDSISAGGARELEGPQLPVPVRLQLSGNLKLWSRLLWQDVGVRYLVGTIPMKPDKPVPVTSFELLGGLRYTYLNQDTRLGLNATIADTAGQTVLSRGGSLFSSLQFSIFEPFVGVRVGLWLTRKFNVLLKADCGGFGFVAYNHVDTVLEALVGYQVHKNIRIYAGYRGRYGSGIGDAKNVTIHGWFHGPMLGSVFSF